MFSFLTLQAYEDTHAYAGKQLSKADIDSRRKAAELLVDFCNKIGFQEDSIHDSVQLLDRLIFQDLGVHNLSQIILFAGLARILVRQGAIYRPRWFYTTHYNRVMNVDAIWYSQVSSEKYFISPWIWTISISLSSKAQSKWYAWLDLLLLHLQKPF